MSLRKRFASLITSRKRSKVGDPPNPAKGAAFESCAGDTQTPTGDANTNSRVYREFLHGVSQGGLSQDRRDELYVEFSKEYNQSLRDGEYEIAVICLMLERMVRKQENAWYDARALAEVAGWIIANCMTYEVTDTPQPLYYGHAPYSAK